MKGLLHFLRTATTRQRHKGVPAYTAPNQTIRDILRSHLTERSHAPAIWVAPQQYRTFREVFDVVDRLAQAVRSLVDIRNTSRLGWLVRISCRSRGWHLLSPRCEAHQS
jgi:hypothetical protein